MKMEPKTYTVHQLLNLKENQMLTVNHEYQRGAVWDTTQKRKLIDSVLRGYPLPLIYLHHIQRSVGGLKRDDLEVIDGQQRINALYEFRENAFKLFDPVRDAKEARFPKFIKDAPCPWASLDFNSLEADHKAQFLNTPLSVAQITTDNPNEARDLFIRLQSGLPLNSQEKRDAWPGGFTDFVLKVGGKPEIARYPGHDFFNRLIAGNRAADRGKARQLCAQIAMLFLTRREPTAHWTDINSRAIDDFYYSHLEFEFSSPEAKRFTQILDKAYQLLGDGRRRRLKGHEAIHIVLLLDGLIDDYTRSWESKFSDAFDRFMEGVARDKSSRHAAQPGEFWTFYDQWTRTNSDRGGVIALRHHFFVKKMFEYLAPLTLKDPTRIFGSVEREIIYLRDQKKCGVCGAEVPWPEHEIHHIIGHAQGGSTTLDNGKLVHRHCHPRGKAADAFSASL